MAKNGLWARLKLKFAAKTNKMLDRAEDPAEILDYSYAKQLEQLPQIKQAVVDITTARVQLERQAAKLGESLAKLHGQAQQALVVGNEQLARTALERKALIDAQKADLDGQVLGMRDQEAKLRKAESDLRVKIERMRTQKEVVKAQYSAAEAQVRVSEAATGVGDDMAAMSMALQRAVDKTDQMKARADAVAELEAAGTFDDLMSLGSGSDDIDRQLAQLSSGSAVDGELAKLKAELGTGTTETKALNAGDSPS